MALLRTRVLATSTYRVEAEVEFADDVVELVGDEVDSLETAIREAAPEARYLDIEADRAWVGKRG